MLFKTKNFSQDALDHFRELQRLSFSILENMAATLQEGQTERDVAKALVKAYRAAGTGSFFHLPVVLFAERTALPDDGDKKWKTGNFFPKSRALKKGDSVIMDAAPLFKGYLVDTSYSFCFGDNPKHAEMMGNLAGFRDQVCRAVNEGQTFKAIADKVGSDIRAMGYEPVHQKHPGEVLGHRTLKIANLPFDWRLQGFDGVALTWFGWKEKLAQSGWGKHSPLWNESKTSDHAPHDGLWLVEPHAGDGPVGAKWEEILVIDNGKARWLDDNPPHVYQWSQIAKGLGYGPRSKSEA